MAVISIYDINDYIKNDEELLEIAGRDIDIFPAIGYEDAVPPFIIYVYSPRVNNVESFWYRTDIVLYGLYDDNVDRLFNMNERIIEMLSQGDQIAQPGGSAGTDFRILSTEITNIQMGAAEERDGWYRSDIEFIIHHVKR